MASPDGYEVMEPLGQQRSDDLPMLVLTAELDEVIKVRARKLGANNFVDKPFNFHALCTKVTTLLLARRQPHP